MSEWIYQYNAKGERVGLVEVHNEPDTDMPYRGMYRELEQQIEQRSALRRTRYDITFREQAIASMEREILQERHTSGYCPAEVDEVIEDWYQTETGTWKRNRVHVTTQNIPFIYKQIQQRLHSWGVHHMSFRDIGEVLQFVSSAYWSADVRGLNKPVVRIGHNQYKLAS